MNSRPPQFPTRFLQWYCKPQLQESILGDLEEQYEADQERYSTSKANRRYTWNTIRFFRPQIIKTFSHRSQLNNIMFKNYFKTSVRSLMKSPISTFINLIGLSAAIGMCIFAYAFIQYTYSTDQFHEHKDEVFLVTFFADREGKEQQFGMTPRPLAEHLQEVTGVSNTCRIETKNVVVKKGDHVFHEIIHLTDPSFLQMLTFPLKWQASQSPLAEANNLIISEEMSQKYFGDENPVGQNLLIKFGNDKKRTFQVAGVAEDVQDASSFSFNFLINFDNLTSIDPSYDFQDWNQTLAATLVQLDNPGKAYEVKKLAQAYAPIHNDAADNWEIRSFGLEPLSSIHYKSEYIRDDIFFSVHENYNSIFFLVTISVILILLACFNYINIAIVSAARRLKEISLRKVIGANRIMIMMQFLTENIFLTTIAALFGLLLGATVFIPWFEGHFSFDMSFHFTQPELYIFLIAIVLLTGFISGMYPSIYVARFHAVSIMKGSLKFGRKNLLTKVLLGFQLILSCLLISIGVMFTLNQDYIANRDWGYKQQQAIYIKLPGFSAYEQLREQLAQDPNIRQIAGSMHHLGQERQSVIIDRPDRAYEVQALAVSSSYFETMSLRLKEGRFFRTKHAADQHKVIINETLATNLKLTKPIGEVIKIDSQRFEVIGVAQDFHDKNFYSKIKPTIFLQASEETYKYLTICTLPGKETETFLALRKKWIELFPEEPFQGGHQEDVWGIYFSEINNHSQFWRGIALIAVLLAALGLYGLVTLNVAGRVREFSIRKTLGARLKNICSSMIRPYLWLYAIGLGVGIPVSYLASNALLDYAYWYHTPKSYVGAIIGAANLLVLLGFVAMIQMTKLSRANPVDGLRSE